LLSSIEEKVGEVFEEVPGVDDLPDFLRQKVGKIRAVGH
jgi:hypothetical protein